MHQEVYTVVGETGIDAALDAANKSPAIEGMLPTRAEVVELSPGKWQATVFYAPAPKFDEGIPPCQRNA